MQTLLQSAIVRRDYSESHKAKEYQAAFEKTGDRRYQELAQACRALARGHKVISASKAMQQAGIKQDGSPVIAIANASAKWVWFEYDAETSNDSPCAAFVSDFRERARWRERSTRATRGSTFSFDRTFFPVRPTNKLIARVPVVPPKYLPRGKLENYQILWEANWQAAPIDPYLLRRISHDFYVIVAEWDLTEIERLVVDMAGFTTRGND